MVILNFLTCFVLLVSFRRAAEALSSSGRGPSTTRCHSQTLNALQLSTYSPSSSLNEEDSASRKCTKCPDDEQELSLDRREILFAMLGWATTTTSALMTPSAAKAVAGSEAKIELPDLYGSMNDRVTKQCLVETLGNRDCLVYMDEANKLYKGVDSSVLLERIEKASVALATVPELVEAKKWSKVTGVLTGPLGQLVTTMNQLIKLSDNSSKAEEYAKKTKIDLYAIAAASDRKQQKEAMKAHQQATNDLVSFIKSL